MMMSWAALNLNNSSLHFGKQGKMGKVVGILTKGWGFIYSAMVVDTMMILVMRKSPYTNPHR